MQRRDFLNTLMAASSSLVVSQYRLQSWGKTSEGTCPPNIILIMADDLGAGELGCYGHPDHQTPNLDALAGSGVRFETCFSAPVCSPSRVMLMTGQYGFRNGWCNMDDKPGGPGGSQKLSFGEKQFTFADLLKQKGYATAITGKWQLPGENPTRVYDCGFDEYLIWTYKGYLPKGVEYKAGYEKEGKNKVSRYYHPGVMHNGKHPETRPTDFGPDLYNQFICDFISRNKEKPFFAYYPMCLTHAPYGPTPDHPDLPVENNPETFKAYVEYMDKLIGKLVKTLDENGLRENTIILFTGDNGTGGNGKYTPTELGARVPLIVNCPGRVQAGVVSQELVDFSDFFPSLAAWSGAPLPTDRVIDGHSFAHITEGKPGPVRDYAFSFLADTRVLRDKRWLLEFNTPDDFGTLYDCGAHRDGSDYRDVTNSPDPEVLAARKRFEEILEKLPAPKLEREPAEKEYQAMRHQIRRKGREK